MSAYLFGMVLVFLGVVGFLDCLKATNISPHPIADCVCYIVFFTCGLLTCIAIRLQYGGGFWSIVGLNFVGFAIIGIAIILEIYIRSPNIPFFRIIYLKVALLLVVGCICLIMGQMRRQKIKKASIKNGRTTPEPN